MTTGTRTPVAPRARTIEFALTMYRARPSAFLDKRTEVEHVEKVLACSGHEPLTESERESIARGLLVPIVNADSSARAVDAPAIAASSGAAGSAASPRLAVLKEVAAEFDRERALRAVTSRAAYVNQTLRDRGLPGLSRDESDAVARGESMTAAVVANTDAVPAGLQTPIGASGVGGVAAPDRATTIRAAGAAFDRDAAAQRVTTRTAWIDRHLADADFPRLSESELASSGVDQSIGGVRRADRIAALVEDWRALRADPKTALWFPSLRQFIDGNLRGDGFVPLSDAEERAFF